jgi:thioredoxin 1
MSLAHINEDLFEQEVLKSTTPVLVDFWAPWCGPCKAMEPTLEKVAEETAGKLKVMKLNIDDNPQLASRYRVMSIPTMLLFVGGNVMEQIVGLVSKDKVLAKVQSHL